ncbi:MAG: FGGY family carbohydrate kinase [Petrimonas sp.]|nr:FGGY family carbohydrate kinase [Petrimonas sp.]
MPHVLAIDIGTSGCRSAIYNEDLEMICVSTAEYPLIVLSEKEIEQDADIWWRKALATMEEVLSKEPIVSKEIKAISISSQGIATVPIDKDGNALDHAISWLDSRAEEEIKMLEKRYGSKALYDRTGKRLSASYSLSKLIWFRNHRQDVYNKAWKILLPMDFIQFKLSGKCVTDHTMAGGTMYYNIADQKWDKAILDDNNLDVKKLADIAWAGDVIGYILPEIANKFGLSHDVLIVNGAQDQKCAAFGAGAAQDIAAVSLGTASSIAQLSDTIIKDPQMRIPFFSYIKESVWDMEGVINTAGSAYNWFKREFGSGYSFDDLNTLASKVTLPNACMFYPYLAGACAPNWGNPTGCFIGLSLNTGLGHAARAVMEGVAYGIKENLEVMAFSCSKAKQIRLYGGGSKSDLWCQIIANITNIPVARLSSSETALAGAAKLAFTSLGVSTPNSLAVAKEFVSDADAVEIYNTSYLKYEQIRKICFESEER